MRTAAWTILITLGCTAVIYTLINHGGPPGFAVVIMAVLSWIAFGALLGHFTGLKRPLANHFGKWKPETAQSITHIVSANDRPSLQLALNRTSATTPASRSSAYPRSTPKSPPSSPPTPAPSRSSGSASRARPTT
jgi:hypothetical protein